VDVRSIAFALLCLCIFLPAAFSAAQQTADSREAFVAAFSQTLLKVVEANGDGFRNIKGPADPLSNGEAWFSTLQLPTARQCLVWIYRDRSLGRRYSCDFGRTFNLDEAQNAYAQALPVVTQSLQGWSKSETSHTSGRARQKVEFTKGSSSPSVVLRLTEHGGHGYLLYLDVEPQE
jgi:hypothetical protein